LRKFTHKINGNVNGNEWNREKGNKEIEGNEEDARKTYLCLKKKGSFCEFYINGNCKIYHFRPSICKIFPFMALRNEESDLEASPFRKFVEGCCPGTKYVTGKEWAIKRIMESKGVGEKDAAIILELITEETTNELIKFGFIDKNRNYINPNG
jgi:Fe-S-cluster containining protein